MPERSRAGVGGLRSRLQRVEARVPGEINDAFVLPELDRPGYDGYVGCEYEPKARTIAGLGWMKLHL